MENLHPRGLVINSIRNYVNGMQFEDPRLTEEKKLLLTLDSLFGPEVLNDFITEYLEGGGSLHTHFFRERSKSVKN